MSQLKHDIRKQTVTTGSIINLLGVVYAHKKTCDDGDLYLTEYGLPYSELLDTDNWFEKRWFETHRTRLSGTSSVYRVDTKEVSGCRMQLVVKNNRVGEDVPLNTHTLSEFINAEFNSPWEEFALTMELRENRFGSKKICIDTQQPLAIYVPSEKLQLWQTGRSRERIYKITLKHPGINLDILRQYKMVYKWIDGLNIVEILKETGTEGEELHKLLFSMTAKAARDLETKGFIMADIKPSHIIINEHNVNEIKRIGELCKAEDVRKEQIEYLESLIDNGDYSLVDYELLMRTPCHEEQVKSKRRHLYLDDQRDRFKEAELPPFLTQSEIFGVPYVHGHVESTGGLLWVVGRNPHLFDYFLPERWRKTPSISFSDKHEVFYTVTKDNIHIVWKTSRVGEKPSSVENGSNYKKKKKYGINSPFEEFAIAQHLSQSGIPTIYMRAIYMTGTTKTESVKDTRHYKIHEGLISIDNKAVLRKNHDYITIRGYYNGPDTWIASHDGAFSIPWDLERALFKGLLSEEECKKLMKRIMSQLRNAGYDGTFLELNDIIISLDPGGRIINDQENLPETRICNFELIHRLDMY